MQDDEQAALRRVATLVASGTPPDEVFAAVTSEIGRLVGAEYAFMGALRARLYVGRRRNMG